MVLWTTYLTHVGPTLCNKVFRVSLSLSLSIALSLSLSLPLFLRHMCNKVFRVSLSLSLSSSFYHPLFVQLPLDLVLAPTLALDLDLVLALSCARSAALWGLT